MDVREKLVELSQEYFDSVPWYADIADLNAEKFVDNLISHGVTVQEDCKACAEATQNCIVKLQEQIAELRSVQEWISVKDRLPERKCDCLTARKGDVYVESWNGVLFSERNHHGQPTHWMPLPQPPKGE